jgi:hypothetical protein
MTLKINLSTQLRELSKFGAILVALSVMNLPGSVFAQEAKYERPLQDTSENAEQLIREMKEVTEKYPVLSQRFGLVKIPGFRIPVLCVGGVDGICHQARQKSCIKSFISAGQKPDYNYCLDQANTGCCRPAVFTEVE